MNADDFTIDAGDLHEDYRPVRWDDTVHAVKADDPKMMPICGRAIVMCDVDPTSDAVDCIECVSIVG